MAKDQVDIGVKVTADTSDATTKLKNAGKTADKAGTSFGTMFKAFLSSQLVVNAASKIYDFGKQSVEAYEQAENANIKFENAMKRLPDASDATTKSLEDQAAALEKTTTYSKLQTEAAQANLAQFHLTGAQIKQLTPLVQDYAARTGTDLPTAAENVGKAMLGQTRALKAVGISITATSAAAKEATAAQNRYSAALRGLTSAQDHLKVVQGEVASGALKGKAAQSALASAHARVAENSLKVSQAAKDVTAAQKKAGSSAGVYGQIVAGLTGKVGGLADKMGETAGGKMKIMQNQFHEFQIQLGSQLMPILAKLATVGLAALAWIKGNLSWIMPLVQGILLLTAAWKAYAVATKVVTFVTKDLKPALVSLNAAMDANPILIIILAVVALAFAFYELYTRCAWFRNAVEVVWQALQAAWDAVAGAVMTAVHAVAAAFTTAFNAVRNAIATAINWIRANWPLIVGILTGPIGVAVLLIIRYWSQIRGALATFLGWLRTAWNAVYAILVTPYVNAFRAISSGVTSLISWFARIPAEIGSAISGVTHAIEEPFMAAFEAVKTAVQNAMKWISDTVNSGIKIAKDIVNPFIHAWNDVHVKVGEVKVLGKTVVPGFTLGFPHIDPLAKGGYLTSATLAVMGEAGPEIASPVPLLRKIVREESGANITLNINVPATANPAETGREVAKVLRSYFSAGGRLTVPA